MGIQCVQSWEWCLLWCAWYTIPSCCIGQLFQLYSISVISGIFFVSNSHEMFRSKHFSAASFLGIATCSYTEANTEGKYRFPDYVYLLHSEKITPEQGGWLGLMFKPIPTFCMMQSSICTRRLGDRLICNLNLHSGEIRYSFLWWVEENWYCTSFELLFCFCVAEYSTAWDSFSWWWIGTRKWGGYVFCEGFFHAGRACFETW